MPPLRYRVQGPMVAHTGLQAPSQRMNYIEWHSRVSGAAIVAPTVSSGCSAALSSRAPGSAVALWLTPARRSQPCVWMIRLELLPTEEFPTLLVSAPRHTQR